MNEELTSEVKELEETTQEEPVSSEEVSSEDATEPLESETELAESELDSETDSTTDTIDSEEDELTSSSIQYIFVTAETASQTDYSPALTAIDDKLDTIVTCMIVVMAVIVLSWIHLISRKRRNQR